MDSCSKFSASLAIRYLSKMANMHASPLLFIGVIACWSHMAAGVADKRLSDAILGDDECASDDAAGCSLSARQLRGDVLSLEAQEEEVDVSDGEFVASKSFGSFDWTPTQRTIEAAIQDAKWNGDGQFHEGEIVNAVSVAKWVNEDLLVNPPFNGAHGAIVPMPASGDDQVGPGNYVAYSRRQVCYIVAKTLMGAGTKEYDNGLTRFMNTCARTGGFAKSMVTLVASCAADPTLKDGKQGPLLVVARGADPTSVQAARGVAASTPLSNAGLRVCQYDDGAAPLDGIPKVPSEGCVSATGSGPGKDFMSGGLHRQVVVDITASWLGGYVLGNACGLGGGQDERLMVYFPEVAALTFFLSASHPFPQLRQPAWVLGARQFFVDLDGTGRYNDYVLDKAVPLNSDLEDVQFKGKTYKMSSSRPFLGFMSESQGFLGKETYNNLKWARLNRHALQREIRSSDKAPFENQVRAWYNSVALTSYHVEVRPTLKQFVQSVGTGPWLAGLWWGDSQLGMLATWIGQALAAPTWGELPVDYYMYADFTENPGNQCYVHSYHNCAACLSKCNNNPLPGTAFWMPNEAFTDGKSCAGAGSPQYCGQNGVEQIYAAFSGKGALDLWDAVEHAFRNGAHTEKTVFDVLLR
mmetsp:Transcript_107608/g.273168  ORF Transcript_107608/g.273168 Transcript_107608/m.273168 type:complete len:637 (-) Transcript_107608:81-1991(-)